MSSLRWPLRRRRENSDMHQDSLPTRPPAAHTASHPGRQSDPAQRRESLSSLPSASSGGPSPRRTSSPAIEQLRNRATVDSRQEPDSSNMGDSLAQQSRSRERWQTASAPAAIRSATPPPYHHHTLDREPLSNPMVLDDRPRVPPPIYLRCASTQPQSKAGTLRIHMPGW